MRCWGPIPLSMDTITLSDLEVDCRVGITAAERAQPQRLRITLDLETDFAAAARTDDLGNTIDYQAVADAILRLAGQGQWQLIEKLAADIAQLVLDTFKPARVTVEVKKYIIPQTRHVAVRLTRQVES
jgi:7,8-dihydroneopterin aldolase/epimerase/oxygenase